MSTLLSKLAEIEASYQSLEARLSEPEVFNDRELTTQISRQLAESRGTVQLYRKYRKGLTQEEELNELLADMQRDDELYEMIQQERQDLAEGNRALEVELQQELLPQDPNDKRNVVLEIRAGTGGDEATLFASELFRMYSRYAERQGWKVEILDLSESGIHGLKEVSAIVEGNGAYSRLKFEGGVHRVQRVPATEASGRIHTSAVTVVVLPEADDIEVTVDEKDLRIDRFCASGPGGQGVNTTYSAVRLTHIPTGLVVTCQDERSQIKNRAKALRVLKSRLYDLEQAKAQSEQTEVRRKMVGSGDRSEKIRTYNFPQSRITDHRAGISIHQLMNVLEGDLDPLIDPLITSIQAEEMQAAVSR